MEFWYFISERAGSASGFCFSLGLVFSPTTQATGTGFWFYSPKSMDFPRQELLRNIGTMIKEEYGRNVGEDYANPVIFILFHWFLTVCLFSFLSCLFVVSAWNCLMLWPMWIWFQFSLSTNSMRSERAPSSLFDPLSFPNVPHRSMIRCVSASFYSFEFSL